MSHDGDQFYPADSDAEPQDGAVAALTLSVLETNAAELAVVFQNPLPEWTLEDHARALEGVQSARRALADAEQGLKDSIGTLMGERTVVLPEYGVLHRSRRKNRTKWDREALLRDVLDTKLIDPETGEVKDESPLDKVRHVWLLGAPRTTALDARGLRADDYCETETLPGWSIRMDGPG